MQTFLPDPDPDFRKTAPLLDPRRLGKPRVEALQVLRGLTVPGHGWRRRPAVRMWGGPQRPCAPAGPCAFHADSRSGASPRMSAAVQARASVAARRTSRARAETAAAANSGVWPEPPPSAIATNG
ncbi:cytoplasmic protein [Streptomyces sp. NBC_00631]